MPDATKIHRRRPPHSRLKSRHPTAAGHRRLEESSRDIAFTMRFPNLRYEFLSPAVTELFGLEPEQFYQDPGLLLRCVAPVWRAQVRAWLDEIEAGHVAEEYLYQVVDRFGRLIWLRQRQVFHPATQGQGWLMHGVATQMSAPPAEAERRDELQRFRALAEAWSEQVMLRVNLRDGIVEYVSDGIERITGRTARDFRHLPGVRLDVVAPEWRAAAALWFEELRQGYLRPEYEYQVLHTSGQRRWVNQRGVILRDAAGAPVVAQFVLFDVTERRGLEDALRESNTRYALLADNVADIIWSLDTDLNWTYLSPSVVPLTGLPLEEAYRRGLKATFTPASLEVARQTLARWAACAQEPSPTSHEDLATPCKLLLELLDADGRAVPTEVVARPMLDGQGRITGFCGTARDVRERLRQESVEAALSHLSADLLECEDLDQTLRLTAACALAVTGAHQALAEHRDPETGRYLGPGGAPGLEHLPDHALMAAVWHTDGIVGRIGVLGLAPAARDEAAAVLDRLASLFALAVARIHAETALRKSERLGRKLLESMHEGVWAVDEDQHTIFVNERLAAMLGYSVTELSAMQPRDVLTGPQRQLALELLFERRFGMAGGADQQLMRKDGAGLPVHVSASPILNGTGAYEGVVLTALDLTERRHMEQELRRSQARFEALFELSRLTNATEQQISSFTLREALRLTGSSSGVLFFADEEGDRLVPMAWRGPGQASRPLPTSLPIGGETPWAMVHTSKRPLLLNDFGLFRHQLPPGHPAVDRFLGVPALDGERPAAVLGITGKAAPYTPDDTLQVSLLLDGMWRMVRGRRDQERIRASLREKESLLREVHHRVKNNLQVVSSLLDMAGRRLPDATARRSMEEVRAKVQAMSLVHAQLLGGGETAGRGVELERYVRALFRQLREVYSGDVKLSLAVALEAQTLGLDQAAPLGLALNEALANVFKHGRREGRAGLAAVRAWADAEGQVVIEVLDDGPGLPEGVSVDTGGGLGMKLMAGLVRGQLGGELTVRSGPGGVCVRIRFAPHVAH